MHSTKPLISHHLLRHAHALGAYAVHDETFRNHLTSLVPPANSEVAAPTSSGVHPLFLPEDFMQAKQRLTWLLAELRFCPSPERAMAYRALMESNVRTEPVDVVLGVVGVAIIGPTLGLIKKKKKRRSIVRVVVSRDVTDQATAAELTTKATTALVRSHLLSAGGSLHRLEPEMAEWFMTDQETKAYTTSGSELQSLAPWLSDAGLPFASVYREERLCALAIPPTVSDALELGTPLTE